MFSIYIIIFLYLCCSFTLILKLMQKKKKNISVIFTTSPLIMIFLI